MSEAPKVWSAYTRTARKEHECCECRETIQPGDTYHVFNGYYDCWLVFKTCRKCQELRNGLRSRVDYPEEICFGDLHEWLREEAR